MKTQRFHAEPRSVRRHAVGEIPGRRAREHIETELGRARRRHRDDAVLVRERGMVDRVVLDVELVEPEPLRQPRAAHERRVAGVKAGPRLALDRKQLAIAPEVFRPAFDRFARERDRRVVVHGLERPEALVAHVVGLGRKHGLAQMTLQP